MNIIQAVKDNNLFRSYLADDNNSIRSWYRWMTCLRVIYGLPITKTWQKELIRRCTGRDPDLMPKEGFRRVLLLCGRRSGKSKISGLVAAYELTLGGREKLCSPGEIPCVSICSPSKDQSQVIRHYARAALQSDILANTLTDDNRDLFRLSNGVTCRILVGSYKHVRSFTQLAILVDEVCFFGTSEESSVKSDTELIRSVRPSLLTTRGPLICISSKYRPSGWAYKQWKKHWGQDGSGTLVWDADSRTMNPTLSQEDIQSEIDDDPVARYEFENLWRDDVEDYLSRESIEAVTIKGRKRLIYDYHQKYFAFVDMSGGRQDSACLAIGHKNGEKIILDRIEEWTAPFSPNSVVRQMCVLLQQYQLSTVSGDRYASGFVTDSFKKNGVRYLPSPKTKSELYLELVPLVTSHQIELLDHEKTINQLCALERKTRQGGKDVVDHPKGGFDDLSNVVAGVAASASVKQKRVGGWRDGGRHSLDDPRRRLRKFFRENNVRVL